MPVSQRSVQAIFDALGRLGVSAAKLGVSRVEDDEALAELWRKAIAHTGRRSVPLELGLAMPLGVMGVVDYLAAASATVGAAVTVAQQVFPLVAPAVQLSLERLRSGGRSIVIWNHPPFVGQSESDLLVLGVLVGRLRQLASRPLSLPGLLCLEDAASSLGLSRRSLQRRLSAIDTTLSRVNDEVRRARAERLVGEGLLTLGEVAAKVGFAEQASFTRAWSRWHGGPPSRRRE